MKPRIFANHERLRDYARELNRNLSALDGCGVFMGDNKINYLELLSATKFKFIFLVRNLKNEKVCVVEFAMDYVGNDFTLYVYPCDPHFQLSHSQNTPSSASTTQTNEVIK